MKMTRLSIVLALAIAFLPVLSWGNTAVVEDVEAGGIIVFDKNGFTARLTGLEVPGLDHALGLEILDFTRKAVKGKRVALFTWTTNNLASGIVHDEDGYPFVQIEYGEGVSNDKGRSLNLNEQLLAKGYARVDDKYLPEDLQHFKEIEQQAKAAGVGIWGSD